MIVEKTVGPYDAEAHDHWACSICAGPINAAHRVLHVKATEGGASPRIRWWVICQLHLGVLEGLDGEELVAAIRARLLVRQGARGD